MNSQVTLNLKGWLKAFILKPSGAWYTVYNDHNQINNTPGTEVTAKALGGESGWSLDRIVAYKAGTLLASTSVIQVSYPAPNKVRLLARFDEASFNDTLDELALEAGTHGKFAQVTGLSITKDDTLQLGVEWTLTITKLI